MEYIRKSRNPERFTVVSNDFIKDASISWKAKGLIVYLMSLPSDWKLNIQELREHSTDGRESTYNGINELIKAGYCKRIEHRENGRILGNEYVVSDCKDFNEEESGKPHTENPYTGKPHTENPYTGKPHTENPTLLNTEYTKSLSELSTEGISSNEDKTTTNKRVRKVFQKPTPDEVDEYSNYMGCNIDGHQFCDYYESKGWMIGKNPMKDWKAAVRTWINNNGKNHYGATGNNQANGYNPGRANAQNTGAVYSDLQQKLIGSF